MIKESYRGHEIQVNREMALGGWENLYFYILRESDNFFVEDSFTEGEDTEEDFMEYLKGRLDHRLGHPEEYEDENDFG